MTDDDVGPIVRVASQELAKGSEGETQEEKMDRIRKAVQGAMGEPMPEEAQCTDCRKYDGTHPRVKEILGERVARAGGNHAVVLGVECSCKQTREFEIERRWMQSGLQRDGEAINTINTFSNFDNRGYPVLQEAYEKALRLTENPDHFVLTLVGPVGVGKSHLLEAACRQALDLGKSARYELSSSIMDNLRSVYSNSDNTYSMADWMQWYSTKWLLAIDDLGTENGTDFVQERLTMILEYRIKNNLRTILSSNEVKGEVENRFGSRVASRLFSSNQHLSDSEVLIINNVPDYRAKKD